MRKLYRKRIRRQTPGCWRFEGWRNFVNSFHRSFVSILWKFVRLTSPSGTFWKWLVFRSNSEWKGSPIWVFLWTFCNIPKWKKKFNVKPLWFRYTICQLFWFVRCKIIRKRISTLTHISTRVKRGESRDNSRSFCLFPLKWVAWIKILSLNNFFEFFAGIQGVRCGVGLMSSLTLQFDFFFVNCKIIQQHKLLHVILSWIFILLSSTSITRRLTTCETKNLHLKESFEVWGIKQSHFCNSS